VRLLASNAQYWVLNNSWCALREKDVLTLVSHRWPNDSQWTLVSIAMQLVDCICLRMFQKLSRALKWSLLLGWIEIWWMNRVFFSTIFVQLNFLSAICFLTESRICCSGEMYVVCHFRNCIEEQHVLHTHVGFLHLKCWVSGRCHFVFRYIMASTGSIFDNHTQRLLTRITGYLFMRTWVTTISLLLNSSHWPSFFLIHATADATVDVLCSLCVSIAAMLFVIFEIGAASFFSTIWDSTLAASRAQTTRRRT